MYATHAREIQAECRRSPAAFRDTLLFVIATIQVPLERVADDSMTDIRANGRHAASLWGMKGPAFDDIERHHKRLHATLYAQATLTPPLWVERALVELVSSIHGLNLPKAGFVLQLAFGEVGCIDTHNRRRFGLDKARIYPERGMKYPTMLKHARAYTAVCQEVGGPEVLWDSWCDYVAALRPKIWRDGEEVSAAHLCAIHPF